MSKGRIVHAAIAMAIALSVSPITSAKHLSDSDVPATTEGAPEAFTIEVTGSLWFATPSGTVGNSAATKLDVVRDFGLTQSAKTLWGRIVVRRGARSRFFVDGSPTTVNGHRLVTPDFTYLGHQFGSGQSLTSKASVDYVSGGYQYDVLTGENGHLGASVSAMYLDVSDKISTAAPRNAAGLDAKIGLPLAGAEFRVFPVPGRDIFDVDGSVRGMTFGNYGKYLEFTVNAGFIFVHHIGVQAGYRDQRVVTERNGGLDGNRIDLSLHGPLITLSYKW